MSASTKRMPSAPSHRAMAKPMPLAAPVTAAVFAVNTSIPNLVLP
jgi:hypothetical protein